LLRGENVFEEPALPFSSARFLLIWRAPRSRRAEQRASWAQISGEVGLRIETLRRWCNARERTRSTAMVSVRVVAERADRRVTVTSTAGYRIEDLSLHEAVAVLRALA
jgi:hypothetical protein